MRAFLRGLAMTAGAALLLAGCAMFTDPSWIKPGTPQAEVLRQLGQPTAIYPAVAGATNARLQYTYEPTGQRVFNFDLDADGRVVRAEQALAEGLFPERIRKGRWTRQDVLREYGPPAQVMGVHNFEGDIWVWRYLQGSFWRLLYIDIDPHGVVQGWSTGDEILPDPPDPGAWP